METNHTATHALSKASIWLIGGALAAVFTSSALAAGDPLRLAVEPRGCASLEAPRDNFSALS